MDQPSLFERLNAWARRSVTLKLFSIGILILLLLIPSTMIQSLVYERQSIRASAVEEVSSKWGREQTVAGPVITLPYLERRTNEKGQVELVKQYAHFLPDELNVSGDLKTEERHRGIHVVVLYTGKIRVQGRFKAPDIGSLGIAAADARPQEASMMLGITDMKGIKGEINLRLNDTTYSFGPGLPAKDLFASGASMPISLTGDTTYTFDFTLDLNGSSALHFLPFGRTTSVTLKSPWASPSFEGYALPESRDVQTSGFTATWKMTQLNRNYPQQGLGNFIGGNADEYSLANQEAYAGFGVRLLLPVDHYTETYRSVKYCLMFIVITFLTFFFVEILNKRRIHPIQYLLVGFAICLFYVLLLSISEHLNFGKSYLIACLAILGLITYYVWHIFHNRKMTLVFSGLLALLYGFFYSLLQLEDYALLLGSLGLFVILGTIMYLTRKVDWYAGRS